MTTVTEPNLSYLSAEDAALRIEALAALDRADADARLGLPPLRQAVAQAEVRYERTRKALETAEAELAEARQRLARDESYISRQRDKALAMIEQTADPAIDDFVRELREEYQALGESFQPVDRVTSRTSDGGMVVQTTARTKANAERNARTKQRMDAVGEAIRQAKALKRDPAANVGEAIERLRAELPNIETPEN